ncbi:MAG: response regulator transcription factor [Bacteroidia bacterium]
MANNANQLLDFYKKEVSAFILEPRTFKGTEHFKRIAALFSPGNFYYWIVNFGNLEMEYVSEGTQKILGIPANKLTASSFLALLSPKEMEAIARKESMVLDFLKNHIHPEQITQYKIIYLIQITDLSGKARTILHQATTLTVDESRHIEHVLNAHTDVSHLRITNQHDISFIHLGDGPSYYNVPSEKGKFEIPSDANGEKIALQRLLTKRELEVLKALAAGLSTKQIAEKLFISPHTVQTHHKNMLAKTGYHKTTDLIVRALLEGLD